MRKIAVIIILIAVTHGYSQEWAKVGTKWWYNADVSYLQSYELGYNTKLGYLKYEYIKDTLVDSELVGFIKSEKHNSDGSVSVQTPILVRQSDQIIEYRFLDNAQWCYFSHIQPLENQTFTGYIKVCNQTKLYNISINGINTFTVDGISIGYYNLNFFDGKTKYNIVKYINIGGEASFYPLINCLEADGPPVNEKPKFGPLRCHETGSVLLKFQIDRYSFRSPNLSSNLSFSCDSILNIIPTSAKESLSPTDFKIYPNPAMDNLFIEANDNFGSIDSIQIYSLHGIRQFQGSKTNNTSVIPLNDLKNGVFFLFIIQNNRKYVYKFVKV
jgi:hypothetical protein